MSSFAAPPADHPRCTRPVEECAARLKETYRDRGWLGVELDENENGALRVGTVTPGSPAEKAGLKTGAIVVALNGIPLTHDSTRGGMARDDYWKAGATLAIDLRRGPRSTSVRVTLQHYPDALVAHIVEAHVRDYHQSAAN